MRSVRQLWLAAALLAAVPALLEAQVRRVSGTVTVQGSTEPVGGATIQVVGTNLGAVADDAGRFTVSVPAGAQQLRVRRIGFQARLVPVGPNDQTVSVALTRDVLQLETQVITGQATTVSSRNAANAVTVVTSERLNRAPSQTVDYALQGKVPGAIITQNSGAPGGGTQVQLRGVTSITANSSPLYVVDGVIMNNASISNGLNAISQAAGGNFSSNQDQQVNRIADINPQDIETVEVLKGASAGAIYGSLGSNGVIVITTKRGVAGRPSVNFIQRLGTQALSNKLGSRCFGSAAEVDAAGFDSTGYGAARVKCNDYEQQLYGRKDLSYETDASIRGGSNSGTTYYAAGTVRNDAGIQVNTRYAKQSLRANLGQQVGPRLNFRVNSELLHTLTERGLSGNDNNGVAPYTIISATPSFFDFRPANGVYPRNPYLPVQTNLLQDAALIRTPENVYRLIGSATGDWSILTGERQTLTLNVLGGVDQYSDASKVYAPPQLYFEPLDDGLAGTVYNSQGNFVNANLNGNLVHRFTAAAFTATTSIGARKGRRDGNIRQTAGRGLPPGITNVSSALQTFNFETQQINKEFSYFAQEEFLTLGERLLLTAAVNSERSSVNGNNTKFYAYPKFAASYNLPWLPPATDNLKLRIAYGRAGNLPNYGQRFTALITSVNDNIIAGRPSTILGNPNIRPETSTELEGGFDLTMFGNRAQLSFTQYRKQVDDLILNQALAPSTGFTTKVIQSGNQLVNRGTEIALNVNVVQRSSFNWVSNTTFYRNRGKVTKLAVPAFLPGGAFSTAFGTGRIEQGKSPTQVYVQVGCNVPLTSSGACRSKKYGSYGDFAPDFQMGFANDINFGPFRLASLFDWRKGGKVINLTNIYFDGTGLLADTALSARRFTGWRGGQPVYAEDGGFVKLRELSLQYALPKAFARSIMLGRAQDVRLELSGRNLKTWTKYTGLDPEVSNFGSQNIRQNQDVTPFPPYRQFFFSLLANF